MGRKWGEKERGKRELERQGVKKERWRKRRRW